MKIRVIAVALVLFALCGRANAFIFDNWYYSESNCATYTPQTPPMAAGKAVCFDSTLHTWFYWTGTAFTATPVSAGQDRNFFTGSTSAVFSQVAAEAFTPVSGDSVATLVAASEGGAMQAVNQVFTCKNLYCSTTNAAGTLTAAGGTSWTITVDDNTVATALTCVETAALTHCSDTTHSFTTAVGDLLDFGWTPAGTPTAIVPHCTMECDL
jgi:hypothetical protein